jgi:hypothetical protein
VFGFRQDPTRPPTHHGVLAECQTALGEKAGGRRGQRRFPAFRLRAPAEVSRALPSGRWASLYVLSQCAVLAVDGS